MLQQVCLLPVIRKTESRPASSPVKCILRRLSSARLSSQLSACLHAGWSHCQPLGLWNAVHTRTHVCPDHQPCYQNVTIRLTKAPIWAAGFLPHSLPSGGSLYATGRQLVLDALHEAHHARLHHPQALQLGLHKCLPVCCVPQVLVMLMGCRVPGKASRLAACGRPCCHGSAEDSL